MNEHHTTDLIDAIPEGDIRYIKFLLDAKADPNERDSNGLTALTTALYTKHLEVVELLLKSEANINTQDKTNGMSALYVAISARSIQLVKLLLTREDVKLALVSNYGVALELAQLCLEGSGAKNPAHYPASKEIVELIEGHQSQEFQINLSGAAAASAAVESDME